MKFRPDKYPTQARLMELLHYDPETGEFSWRVKRGRMRAGTKAGCVTNDGYVQIAVDYMPCLAHRLAWVYMTGGHPPAEIDHEDRCRQNNRWANLREASPTQNQQNVFLRRDNNSGFKGVSFNRATQKWMAQIRINGTRKYLGVHNTPEEAAVAYNRAANDTHGDFAPLELRTVS